MIPFFNRTGLERIGGVGLEFGLLLGWSAGSGCGLLPGWSAGSSVVLPCKDKKEEGSAGLRL